MDSEKKTDRLPLQEVITESQDRPRDLMFFERALKVGEMVETHDLYVVCK